MQDQALSDETDFRPAASWQNLRLRADLLARLRDFFRARGFLEVETPILSRDTVVDRHLDPLSTTLAPDPRRPEIGERLWLQTSPEFHMKRLMAAGGEAIFQVTRSFRGGESGRLHNPEFTIVEWYHRGDDYQAGMELTSQLCDALLGLGPAERISYAEAFDQWAGLNPHTATGEELSRAAAAKGVAAPASLDAADRDGWLNLLLAVLVEPHLGSPRPTILYDYPAGQAALAKVREGDPPVAERFELYVRSVELANGYHELLDAETLRIRNRQANLARQADGKPPLPEESRLLSAMQAGLPPCCGVALGFDRLVMLAAGATTLSEVLAFGIDRA